MLSITKHTRTALIGVALAIAAGLLFSGCASMGTGVPMSCPRLYVENRGYETVEIGFNGRRIGSVEGFSDALLSMCGIERLTHIDVRAIGGRYEFQVPRIGPVQFFGPADTIGVQVGEFMHTSAWMGPRPGQRQGGQFGGNRG